MPLMIIPRRLLHPPPRRQRNELRYDWLRRLVYYITFYIVLFGIFVGYMNALMYFTIDRNKPALTGRQSGLRFNPGLSIMPITNMYTGMIYIESSSQMISEGYTHALSSFLYPYQRFSERVEMIQCAINDGSVQFDPDRPCSFNLGFSHPCSMDSDYGYDSGDPCILLKLNKVYGWLPDPVEGATGVVVKCEGVTADDQFNLGNVRYFDLEYFYSARGFAERGRGRKTNGTFHADFYPYLNQRWYLQPIVWVVFNEMKRDTLVRVQCWLIARNIHVDFKTGEGSVRFEILLE